MAQTRNLILKDRAKGMQRENENKGTEERRENGKRTKKRRKKRELVPLWDEVLVYAGLARDATTVPNSNEQQTNLLRAYAPRR